MDEYIGQLYVDDKGDLYYCYDMAYTPAYDSNMYLFTYLGDEEGGESMALPAPLISLDASTDGVIFKLESKLKTLPTSTVFKMLYKLNKLHHQDTVDTLVLTSAIRSLLDLLSSSFTCFQDKLIESFIVEVKQHCTSKDSTDDSGCTKFKAGVRRTDPDDDTIFL